jgi:hypothetical protein
LEFEFATVGCCSRRHERDLRVPWSFPLLGAGVLHVSVSLSLTDISNKQNNKIDSHVTPCKFHQKIVMGDRSRSAERLKTPGNKTGTPKLPSVRPPTRVGGAASQKSHAAQSGSSNPNYTEREQEKLMSKWRVNVSRSRLCESAKCSFGGWRCPECVREIVFGHCMLFEEMEGKVFSTSLLLPRAIILMPTIFLRENSKSGKCCRQITACAFC